ncbi:TraB/GumN family protein [Brevundimonas sp. TWP2-3-4b2]|uniref:TraB/GumN family protein n=1 Tax=Brevundimonas sp. TWP2-3-4b2 TaxID=2804595 RepID=UPI003CF21848
MNKSLLVSAIILTLVVTLALSAKVQAQEESATVLDDIVVVARRSGAPVWLVQNGEATVILVGSLAGVPADTPWRPEALEAAVARADSVILSQSATMTLGDYFRLRRARAHLPEGKTTADYLTPEWQTRLADRERAHRRDYETRGLTWIADDLLGAQLRYRPGTGRSASDVVRDAARRFRKPVDEVGNMNGRHIDEAVAVPDEGQVACLTAAIMTNESGVEGVRARGLAWTRQDVPAVLANPREWAADRCQWFADETLIAQGRTQWSEAVGKALAGAGTTMVVAPISVVAEPGGLLDQAEGRGLDVVGPEWRPVP